MEEVIIYQKRNKLVKSLLIGFYTILLWLLFLGLGIYNQSISLIVFVIIGLLITLYCDIILIHRFIKPKAILTISEKGIIERSTIPSIGEIPWEEIDQIYTAKAFKKTSIYIKLKDDRLLYSRFPKWKALFIKLNTPKSVDPIVINLQTADIEVDEVFSLLNSWLKHYRKDMQSI
jgi:energy-converting hydrogenase Eha subunit E